jgi:hypothetical protein
VKKVQLDGKERDINLCEAVMAEAQSQGLNPQENHEELMDHVELQRCHEEARLEHITEAVQLAILVGDISKVLLDLGIPTIPRIPQPTRTASDVLEATGTVLECLQEAYASADSPWD